MARHNEKGEEVLDDTPVEVPLRFSRPVSDAFSVEAMLARLREEQLRAGEESYEESMDMEMDDDADISSMPSRYELDDDAEERALTYVHHARRLKAQRKESHGRSEPEADRKEGGDRDGKRDDKGKSESGDKRDDQSSESDRRGSKGNS